MKTFIYYTKFSDYTVFSDPRLNVFCNQMFTFLINKLDESTIKTELILDGDVALHLQDEEVLVFSKIKFSTFSTKVFDVLKASVSSLNASEIYLEENKITLKFQTSFIEINLVSVEIKTFLYNGIYLNNKGDIQNQY